jgi:hypothetical protein
VSKSHSIQGNSHFFWFLLKFVKPTKEKKKSPRGKPGWLQQVWQAATPHRELSIAAASKKQVEIF